MATLYAISEQVQSLLEGGDPSAAPKFDLREISRTVIQIINTALKTQHFTQTMAGGENIPDGLVLAEYDNVAVETYKNVSRATLPAMPVSLPMNMGVYHVSKTDDVINGFIPFQPGELQMIGEDAFISDILGQIGYEPRGKYIVFNKDITVGDDETRIEEVYLLLVVKDLSLYGDWDLLPISADLEATVIQQTFEFLKQQMPQDKKVDVINKQPEVAK